LQLIAIATTLSVGMPGFSGPFEDGLAARDRGDYAGAFGAFKSLATAGDANSQFQLSLLYSAGRGVNANPQEALRWLKQAAIRGQVQAQSNLGNAFNAGRGVPQNLLKSYAWLSIAAATRDSVAITNRDVVAKKLTPQQIEQANALVRQCLAGNFMPCL
jgi:TPR repeat protein